MITKTTRKLPVRPTAPRRIVGSSITANARPRILTNGKSNNIMASLTPEKRAFVNQIRANARKTAPIMAATNTTNIMARPDFLELLPLFVHKLHVLDMFGSVAMKSRQQLIPYFKFIAENTKGETAAGDILSSPFVNRQGIDPNFTGRVIKNEVAASGTTFTGTGAFMYTPVLPNTITLSYTDNTGVTTKYVDNGAGGFVNAAGTDLTGSYINYSTGEFSLGTVTGGASTKVVVTYQYDNENVGPRPDGNGNFGYEYGAQMAKGYLQLDEFNLVAEAHELACYWSVFSAFAAQTEYGGNVGEMAKESAISEITAEMNTKASATLLNAASFRPQFNWDASPVLTGAVVPSDYLNMFKLKLNQAASSIFQATRLTRPNRLNVGTNVASYLSMVNGFQAEGISGDDIGMYKLGKLDEFDIYCDPNYNPDTWVMYCKSNDIRRNSALFGEYMPITSTDQIGLANASVQQGTFGMWAMKVVNPATVVSGKILGVF